METRQTDKDLKIAHEYLPEGYAIVPLEPSEERQKAFAKVWFKSGWSHWSTDKSADKERFNAAYKTIIGVSDE